MTINDISTKRKDLALNFLLWSCLVFVLVKLVIYGMGQLPFTPDSWSYWELSKSVFSGDFYKVYGVRQFQNLNTYSSAFPPLWPILIGSMDKVWGIGPAIMPALAGSVFLLGSIFLERIVRKNFGFKYIGITIGMTLLLLPHFAKQVFVGGTIPLSFLIICLMLGVWLQKISWGMILKLGLLSGLLVLSRFDQIPVVFFAGVTLILRKFYFEKEKVSLAQLFSFAATFLLVLSPYILYSQIRFGSMLATDNSLITQAASNIHVTDYFVHPPATIFDSPIDWVKKILGNSIRLFSVKLFLMELLVLIGALFFYFSLKKRAEVNHKMNLLMLFVLFSIFSSAAYILTGYFQYRYFCIQFSLTGLVAIIYAFTFFRQKEWLFKLHIGLIVLSGGLLVFVSPSALDLKFQVQSEREILLEQKLDLCQSCVSPLGEESRLVFEDVTKALMVAAIENCKTVFYPRNFGSLDNSDKVAFLKKYSIKAHYGDPAIISNIAGLSIKESPCMGGLYILNLN